MDKQFDIFLAQIVVNLMQTANKKAKELLSNYFSEYLFTSEEELSQAYLANRIHGLSFNLSLFEKKSYFENFINAFIKTVETVMYKDKDTNLFDAFVIQIKDEFIFVKKHIKLENSRIYDSITDLPFTEKSEGVDEFPSITYCIGFK